ncbi:MAG: DNA recombination protein RmuC, partial [Pseudomonadota bacterium]
MIQFGDVSIALDEPLTLAALAGVGVAILIVGLLIAAVRRAGRSAAAVVPLAQGLDALAARVEALSEGQAHLGGAIQTVSDTHTAAQSGSRGSV